jgi:hypothetical protein
VNTGTKMVKRVGMSPYTKGTTLNKLANYIVQKMQVSGKSFSDILKSAEMRRIIATHNHGEFRRYPHSGQKGSFNELIRLAVSRKLGKEITV